MTLDDLLLLGEQMQRWQARIDNGEAGDWPHPETATFVRAALERIPALRAELAEWERLARDQHAALVSANKWPREGASQKCGWCVEAAGNDQAAWDAAPKYTLEEARAHATVCPHSPLVRELAEAQQRIKARGQSGTESPGHANAVGGGHVRSGASPATGNVAEPQSSPEGSSALDARALPLSVDEQSEEHQVSVILSEWLADFDEHTEVGRVARCALPQTKQLVRARADLAEAHEALTAARTEVVQLRAAHAALAVHVSPKPNRCGRCHTATPNPNGCARCNPERLGERLTEALGKVERATAELAAAQANADRLRCLAKDACDEAADAALLRGDTDSIRRIENLMGEVNRG